MNAAINTKYSTLISILLSYLVNLQSKDYTYKMRSAKWIMAISTQDNIYSTNGEFEFVLTPPSGPVHYVP